MKVTIALLAAAALSASAGALFVYSGIYNVGATNSHFSFTYWLLDVGMRRSVGQRAAGIAVPPLEDRAMQRRGLEHYHHHCAQCHGAPGIAPAPFALGMAPAPANLAVTGRDWRPADLFWVVKYGIKMSGMPAWEFRLDDRDLWEVVAFLKVLPNYTAEGYRTALGELGNRAIDDDKGVAGTAHLAGSADVPPDRHRGQVAMLQYACSTCHLIPGVVGANAPVGPPLDRMATRRFIAGVLPNTPENMRRWLRDPQAVDRQTLMPNLQVSERDASDIAAYLATLR